MTSNVRKGSLELSLLKKKFRKFVDKCFGKGYIGKQLQERYYF